VVKTSNREVEAVIGGVKGSGKTAYVVTYANSSTDDEGSSDSNRDFVLAFCVER
jgi:hypothetical protein